MKLKYKAFIYSSEDGYEIKCPNISCYVYWTVTLPYGVYKEQLFGLFFIDPVIVIRNRPSGIRIIIRN